MLNYYITLLCSESVQGILNDEVYFAKKVNKTEKLSY